MKIWFLEIEIPLLLLQDIVDTDNYGLFVLLTLVEFGPLNYSVLVKNKHLKQIRVIYKLIMSQINNFCL